MEGCGELGIWGVEGGRRRGRQRYGLEGCGKRSLDEGEGCGELGIWGVEGGRVWRTRDMGSGGWKGVEN